MRGSASAACPRLVAWREAVAVEKRRAFAAEPYWGRADHRLGFGAARLFGAGARSRRARRKPTGRVFTGDRSGDQLFAALYRAGLVSSPLSIDASDGLRANRIQLLPRCVAPRPGMLRPG